MNDPKNSKGYKLYKTLLAEDRKLTKEMVSDRVLRPEDGALRDDMRTDKILDSIPEELFEEYD